VAYKYTGKERDTTTGLYFYEARYYDPMLGRFISPDSVIPDPLEPQALNRYTYVLNNPVIYTDPSGQFFEFIAAVIISATVHAAIDVTIAAITGGDLGDAAITGAIRGASLVAFGGPGVLQGATSGAASAAATRGDPLRGAVRGGIQGYFAADNVKGSGGSNPLLPTNNPAYSKLFQQIGTAVLVTTGGEALVATVRGEDIGKAVLNGAQGGLALGFSSVSRSLNRGPNILTNISAGDATAIEESINPLEEILTTILSGGSTKGLGILGSIFKGTGRKSISIFATKGEARYALDGDLGKAANRFFRDAGRLAQDFKITELSGGGRRFEFFVPARNAGYGKNYVQEVYANGRIKIEYRDTIGPTGFIERKITRTRRR